MNGEQLSVKWSNFQSTIIAAFESLQSTEDLADVTLTCEGLNVKAHKVILSACSPYFRTVFRENPCSHPIVILKDVLYTDMLAILKFMYHGEVLLHKDQLSTFLQTAEVLQVSGLMGRSQHGMATSVATAHSPTQHVLANDSAAVLRQFPNHHQGLPVFQPTRHVAKNTREIPHTRSSPQKRAKVGAIKVRVPIKFAPQAETVVSTALDVGMKTDEQNRDRDRSDKSDYSDNSDNNNEPTDIETDKGDQTVVPSLLEAALESNSNGAGVSILERSLKSLGKPTAAASIPPPLIQIQTTPSQQTASSKTPPSDDSLNKTTENNTANTVLIKTELVEDMSAEEELHDDTLDDMAKEYASRGEAEYDDDDLGEHMHLQEPANLVETIVTVLGSGDRGGGFSYGQPHLSQHMQQHHSSQCGNCPHCGKTYSNQSALKYHVRLVHSDMLNLYCCHLCPLTFDYRDGYKRHMVDVHNFRN